MKIKQLHIIILFLILANFQCAFAISAFQEPYQERKFDADFKDRYSGRTFNYEGKKIVTKTPSGSGEYEDYKNNKPTIKEKNDSENISINLGPFAWVFYLAIAIAVIYLVYILLNEGSSGLFSTKKNRALNNHEDITAKNIEKTDINALIIKAEKDSNFRLATRYYYLLTLKTLSLKNHIKIEDDKTNADYINEIENASFNKKFAYTSYLYNYIWYGEFPLSNDTYSKAKHNFVTFLNQLK